MPYLVEFLILKCQFRNKTINSTFVKNNHMSMSDRKYNLELVLVQENIRRKLLESFLKFEIINLDSILLIENIIYDQIDQLINATNKTNDELFFKYYKLLLCSIFNLLKWGQSEIKAIDGLANLKASKTNIELINLEYFNYINDFKVDINDLKQLIQNTSKVSEIKLVIDKFMKIQFPTIYTFCINSFSQLNEILTNVDAEEVESESEIILLSIQFLIDGEPWANPQILKPEEMYNIKGKLTLNKWPSGYDTLILKPISTSDNNWYNLSLPQIKKSIKNEYEISGQIVFKYPQNSFDESISIKLLGYFQNLSSEILTPTIIGYDQLILKVLDPNSTFFLTGFKMMNKVVYEIVNSLKKELKGVDKEEINDFEYLLSGILNYQGFCLQQGIYKNQTKIPEYTFRDNLIQHLIGLQYLGENIIKEGSLAGGRVEISYKGIIAELKVESNISDRQILYQKYGKQPVAYASGNTKQLSILCILDLTEKILPSAPPQNSVKLLTPKVHGFENTNPEYPSKLALIIIDGNNKKPSDYSK